MTQISPHFTLEEFACRDGTAYPVGWLVGRLIPLVKDLEEIRAAVGRPLIISSGYRTPAYNRKIGGSRKSMHVEGLAVDFTIARQAPTQTRELLFRLIREGRIRDGGVGAYPTFTHYDHRGHAARWTGTRRGN